MMTDKLRESISIFGDRPCYKCGSYNCDMSCEAALAEPTVQESLTVAEPVAWKHPDKNMVFWKDTKDVDEYHGFKLTIPLYAAPSRREWVGLTDEEIAKVANSCVWSETYHVDFSRAIEAKLREKNT